MRKLVALLSFFCIVAVCAPALARPHYPMKAPEYRKMITARVEAVWARIEKKLEFHNVTSERMKEIKRTFDAAAREVWVEVDKASADGTVTRDEALRVGALTSSLRGKVRGRLAAEKKAGGKPSQPPSRATPKAPGGKPGAAKPAPAAQPKPASAPKAAPKASKPAAPPARPAAEAEYEGD